MDKTAELLKQIEDTQWKLKIESLYGAMAVMLTLIKSKDWEYKQKKELLSQVESIQWAINELTVLKSTGGQS